MYVMKNPSKWENNLHIVYFSYNNGYQALLKMQAFEALNGRKCNMQGSWDNLVETVVIGP
jgi:hypothetical protein